jgi:hypothetical protein
MRKSEMEHDPTGLKAKRRASGREAWLQKVEQSKRLPWLFRYRIGHPRAGWRDVPWCEPWAADVRLIMTWNTKAYSDWFAYQKLRLERWRAARKLTRSDMKYYEGE